MKGRLPVPILITGYDATRPVAQWDEDGRRIGYVAPVPQEPVVRDYCEFCHQAFEHRVAFRRTRARRTCSMTCAARLRSRIKSARGAERFKAAQAARWLTFPREVVVDGE